MSKENINKKKLKSFEKKTLNSFIDINFWGIFKSKNSFELYKPSEQLELCQKIRQPMLLAVIICQILLIVLTILSINISKLFLIPLILLTIRFLIRLYLMIEYTILINELKNK